MRSALARAALLAVSVSMPAHADCMDSCMAGYGRGNDYEAGRIESGTYCGIQQGSCEVFCSRKTKAFGAIA